MTRDTRIIFGLIFITLLAFAGVSNCGFLNFDDYGYVAGNPHVLTGLSLANFRWAWTTFDQGNYLPLTWLSFMLDATVFSTKPLGFHLTNLALHTANAVLVFLIFRNATGAVWRSALAAAIFAVHPLRVESVAWVVERKDVLTAFFGFLTMLAYLRFARTAKWHAYSVMLLLFALTLFAKQTMATLPCVLLLMDYWPLRRWRSGASSDHSVSRGEGVPGRRNPWFIRRSLLALGLEKLPLFLMSAAIIRVTRAAQNSTHSEVGYDVATLAWRLGNIPVSYARYLGKMFWFGNLAPLYPRVPWSNGQVAASCGLLIVITVVCALQVRCRPWLLIGWLWFLGVLAPMNGIAQFGPQAMADRFTYFSGLGLLVMILWSIPEQATLYRALVVCCATAILCLLVSFTMKQVNYWQNDITLFKHEIAVTGSNGESEFILGKALRQRNRPGDLQEAIEHLRIALRLEPDRPEASGDLALALAFNKQFDEALSCNRLALEREPSKPDWHVVEAYILQQTGQPHEAVAEADSALALNQNLAFAHRVKSMALEEMGHTRQALEELESALRLNPGLKDGQVDLNRLASRLKSEP